MIRYEGAKFKIEWEKGDFYDMLALEEKKRFLIHILALKHKTFVHEKIHLKEEHKKSTGRKPTEKGVIKRGRPFI